MRFHPPAFAALALAAAVFAAPAAALTLEFEFEVDGVLGGPAPAGIGDVFRARATFPDEAAPPVVFGETFQPLISLDLFLDGPDPTRFDQAGSDVLGWFVAPESGGLDRLRLLGQTSTGAVDWIAWGLPEDPLEAGLSHHAVGLSVLATAPAGFLDGMGPEQIGRLGEMDVSLVLTSLSYVSAWDAGRERYVWQPATLPGDYRVSADMISSREVSPVPVPAAGLLLPAALGALATVARRRRAARG